MIYLFALIAGFFAWLIGTTAAGGAAILFIIIASFFLPLSTLPIIVSFAGTLAGCYRVIIFRHDINWRIIKWLLPGTILGAIIGASLFATIVSKNNIHWLEILVGLVSLASGSISFLKKEISHFNAETWYFMPFGFVTATLSGLIGASSPVINILLRKFALTPIQLVATRSFFLYVQQITKTITYIIFLSLGLRHMALFGKIDFQHMVAFSIVVAIGASLGIYFGKRLLHNINEKLFKFLVNLVLILIGLRFVFSGCQHLF